MLQIDIATKIIPADHRVFVLHPGDEKRFYMAFFDQKLVFLDLPGANFPEKFNLEDPTVRAEVYKSRALARWYRRGAEAKEEPSRSISSYIDKARRQSVARQWNEIQALYLDAKPGDIIVAPGPGYTTPVWIGELVGPFTQKTVAFSKPYETEPIPARRVRWMEPFQQKREFSERLIKLMQNRQALIEIRAAEEREEIYDLVYQDYAFGDEAVGRTLVTTTTTDLRDIGRGTEIIYYFAALYLAADEGRLEEFCALSIRDAIDQFYVDGTFTNTGIELHSPGDIWLHTKRITLPAFLGVMLSLSGANAAAADAASVKVTNSSANQRGKDECALEVATRVHDALNAMGADLWVKVCKERQKEKAHLGVESPMKVTPVPDPKP